MVQRRSITEIALAGVALVGLASLSICYVDCSPYNLARFSWRPLFIPDARTLTLAFNRPGWPNLAAAECPSISAVARWTASGAWGFGLQPNARIARYISDFGCTAARFDSSPEWMNPPELSGVCVRRV